MANGPGDLIDVRPQLAVDRLALRLQPCLDRIGRALADASVAEIDAAHPRLRGERHEGRGQLMELAAADAQGPTRR